jgi:MFS family permease
LQEKKIFFVIFMALFVAMLGVGIIAPAMPLYAKTLGATGIGLGIIYSTFSLARAIFMPVTGKLSDKKGRKIFICMGLAIYSLASLGYIWSNSVIQMVWIRFLHGIGSAMVIPIATAVIGDISPKGKEGSMMGNFQVALFVGFGAGPLLGGVVMNYLGMAEVFYFMGCLSCISLLLMIIFLPEKSNNQGNHIQSPTQFKALLKHASFKGLLVFRFSNAVGRASIITFIPIFASHLNMTSSQIGQIISLNIFLTGILQILFGKLADRFSRPHMVITGLLIGAVPLFLTPFAQNFFHLILLGILMGIGGGIAFPAAGAMATVLGRDHGMGNVMGFFNMSMSLGMIVGPITSGLVMDLLGLPFVFIFGGLIALSGFGGCLYFMFKEKLEYTK